MSRIKTKSLDIAYAQSLIVEDLNISIPTGKVTALVGPNGSGKSTILKTMSRLIKPQSGGVLLDGKLIHKQPTKDVAKELAILPQSPTIPEGLTVEELIRYGRYPHRKELGRMKNADKDAVYWALQATGMVVFKDRELDQLSGGQRQRAWIAMALAQQTDILFLDEPTTFLDMAHQLEVLHLLERLNKQQERTIVMVVHDLNHAARYAHHMVAIKDGQVISEGAPSQVMSKDVLRDVFSIEADIIQDPRTNVPLCLPFELAGNIDRPVVEDKQKETDKENVRPISVIK